MKRSLVCLAMFAAWGIAAPAEFDEVACAQAPFGAAAPAPAAGGEAAAAPASNNPAVAALLSTNPRTPQDLLQVVLLLLDIREAPSAKPLLTKLMESAADEQVLLDLGRRFDRNVLTQFAEATELQPESKRLVAAIAAAQSKQARDPARIAEWIGRLQDPSFDVRAAAISALRGGREVAAQELAGVMVDPARAVERPMVGAALAGMDQDGVGPLTVLAESADEAVRVAALEALGLTTHRGARTPLYRAAFSPRATVAERAAAETALRRREPKPPTAVEAAGALYLEARNRYVRSPSAEPTATAAVWRWDAAAKKAVVASVPERGAALDEAARLARVAAEIAGNDRYALLLGRAATLESLLSSAAGDAAKQREAATAWAEAERMSAADLESLLDFTTEHDRSAATAATVRLLAARGGLKTLESPIAGKPSRLVKAASHPDRRVCFAAVEAILALGPSAPFVGSSGVAESLGYFAGSTGERKALVVDVGPARARDIGGVLGSAGYAVETTATSRDAVHLIANDPDFELVLMYRPFMTAEQGALLARLRANPRTARLPVVVYCEPNDVVRTESFLSDDRFAAAIHQPRTVEMLTTQLQRFDPAGLVTPAAERTAQAQASLTAIARLSAGGGRLWNFRPFEERIAAEAWSSTVGRHAVAVLGNLGTPTAQRTLVDVAAATLQPIEHRRAAGAAFAASVVRHGLLLTSAEVLRQYDRYNASETLDRPTQQVLATILDVIEARAAKVVPTPASQASAGAPPP